MGKGRIIVISILWALVVVLGAMTVFRERVPQYTEESQTAGKHILSKEIQPSDVVEQEFMPSQEWLESVSVAIDYSEQVDKENTKVLVEVLQGDTILQSQELAVWVFPKLTFLRFAVGHEVDMEVPVTIRVTNATAVVENGTGAQGENEGTENHGGNVKNLFALMTTDLEYLYLENAQNYTHNGAEQNGRLFTNATYRVGYDYYPALTRIFWLVGGAIIISGLLLKKQHH